MTKQENILNLVKVWAVIPHPHESRDAEGLLNSLASEGVVLKVDRMRVAHEHKYSCDWFEGYNTCYDEMAGYVAVEPLIERTQDVPS